jgi:molybdopterin-guanine dinucleotide biosynthesis protein A
MSGNVTGIILAGGKSSRMGNDKAFVKYKNKYLIEYAIEALTEECSDILISANDDIYSQFGFLVIEDIFPDTGPMGGIYSCLKHSSCERNVVLPCDMPGVSAELVRYLLSFAEGENTIVAESVDNKIEPLCAVYHKTTLPVFEKFLRQEEYAMNKLLNALQVKKVCISEDISFYRKKIFWNINTFDDLIC